MRNRKYLFSSLIAILILFFLYKIAGAFWFARWFDNLIHFLGGLSIGFFALWAFKRNKVSIAVSAAMIIGILWEIFEYHFGITNPIGSYPVDTFFDLLSDLIGGVTAGLLARIIEKNKKFNV